MDATRWWLPPAAALLSAGLLWAAFFPLDAGWLAWVALVPWLLLAARPATTFGSRVWLYGWAWLGGLACCLPALAWVGYAYHPAMKLGWIGLALYCSFYPPATLALLRGLHRAGWPLALSFAVVTVSSEYARAHLLTGFAWYYLAHTQHGYLPIIQISDLGGAFAVSAVVAAVNGVLAAWLLATPVVCRVAGLPTGPRPWGQTAGVAMAVVAVLGYGAWRLSEPSAGEGPVVALLQGGQSQELRNDGTIASKQALLDEYCRAAGRLARDPQGPPALMVWPETSYPVPWCVPGDGLTPEATLPAWRSDFDYSAHMASDLTHRLGGRTAVLLGVSSYVRLADGKEARHNSAVLVAPDGVPAGRYDKVHCVPFGEYVPAYRELPFLRALSPVDPEYGLTPGREMVRLPLQVDGRTWHVGAIICYEDSDPTLARQYVAAEPRVDFLVNMTDDAWFDGSWEPEQHLAISRFRAVECRRPLLRAVHLGISAVIDGNGRVLALPGPSWAASKSEAGSVVRAVPLDSRWSLYAAWGDWLPALCLVALAVGLAWPWRGRR